MGVEELREKLLKYAVLNAYQHGGKAQPGPVISRLMAEHPELRQRVREILPLASEVVEEVNSWTLERQGAMLMGRWPELLAPREEAAERGLPPLPNVGRFEEVRTRFAPNPDGPLHLGSARPIILCSEYSKIYRGKFILRFEDTSPEVKAPLPEMYESILEDLRWLGAEPDEVYIQSDRMEIYYSYARKLLSVGAAYVCTCPPAEFKRRYMAGAPCPCRDLPPEESLERWDKMLDGSYDKGEAVVRIKTDLHHPNPSVRDWPALRISTTPHPRVGTRYRVWPLYNFSCAIDDHEMRISHVIRGKEHEVNTTRQRFLFEHMGWEFPEVISVGRLGLEVGVLSKSKIRAGVQGGVYSGWDDPRLGTLKALRRRGIQPEAIRRLMIEVGPKPSDATISWGNLATMNRRIVEPVANRYFFVADPAPIRIAASEEEYIAALPLHPDHPERGVREMRVKGEGGAIRAWIAKADLRGLKTGDIIRLMGLFNIEITGLGEDWAEARYHSRDHRTAREMGARFIHWLPWGENVEARVIMPDATVREGLAEASCSSLKPDEVIQFERFGFVRVDKPDPFLAYYAHD